MIQFDKPQNLNGFELVAELEAKGIKVIEPLFIDGNGDFWIDIDAQDKEAATLVVSAHNGTVIPSDNTASKAALLDKLGITQEEAKLLLS